MELPTAPTLDDDAIHLWRLLYQRCEGRMGLHAVLARYLGVSEAAVMLEQQTYGRPVLGGRHRWLGFNWSHSGDHAVIALARQLPVLGVDIEAPRARPRAAELAKRYFRAEEADWIDHADSQWREQRFKQLWTAKEAVLKAHGRGLAYGLDKVGFTPSDSDLVPGAFEGAVGPASEWQLAALDAPGLTGHVAWRGPARRLHYIYGW